MSDNTASPSGSSAPAAPAPGVEQRVIEIIAERTHTHPGEIVPDTRLFSFVSSDQAAARADSEDPGPSR